MLLAHAKETLPLQIVPQTHAEDILAVQIMLLRLHPRPPPERTHGPHMLPAHARETPVVHIMLQAHAKEPYSRPYKRCSSPLPQTLHIPLPPSCVSQEVTTPWSTESALQSNCAAIAGKPTMAHVCPCFTHPNGTLSTKLSYTALWRPAHASSNENLACQLHQISSRPTP